MSKKELIKLLSELKVEIRAKYKAKIVGLFGSYAREENTGQSDMDLLIENEGGMTLFDLAGLKIFLEEKFNIEVDLATTGGLREEIKPYVYKEIIYL